MSPRRVLLCDDSADYRSLVRAVLEDDDTLIVGEAADGGDCVDKVAELQPDVVLLDVSMPRVDGLTALPRLREAAPGASIVMLTTGSGEELERSCMTLGARAFLRKPRDIFTLPAALRAALA